MNTKLNPIVEKVKLTRKQVDYIDECLWNLGDENPDDWGDKDLAAGAQLARTEIDKANDNGTAVLTVTAYLLWRLEADVERMHPSQSDSDWVSVQEYSYALRFLRKIEKAAYGEARH